MSEEVKLVFTKQKHSFKVNILNLESLSVQTIQKLELFVKNRNGIFDFETYSFIIRKNLAFYEFEALMHSTDIRCSCSENIIYQKNQPRIEFGQYKGMFFCDLDDAYILWLKSNYRGVQREFVDKEVISRKL